LSIILEFFSFNGYVLDFGLEGGVLGLGLGSCGLGLEVCVPWPCLGGYVLVNITGYVTLATQQQSAYINSSTSAVGNESQ